VTRALVLAAMLAMPAGAVPASEERAPCTRPLTEEDRYAAAALFDETIAVAKIVEVIPPKEALDQGALVLEPQRVLKGGKLPARLRAVIRGRGEGASYRGKSAIVFLMFRGTRWYAFQGSILPAIVTGPGDPVVERLEAAIRRTSLDSLTAAAEVICVARGGGTKRAPRAAVIEWVSGPGKADTVEVFEPRCQEMSPSPALLFLGRNPLGKLESLGMGAGTFYVVNGKLARLDWTLDETLRVVRARRIALEAHR